MHIPLIVKRKYWQMQNNSGPLNSMLDFKCNKTLSFIFQFLSLLKLFFELNIKTVFSKIWNSKHFSNRLILVQQLKTTTSGTTYW